VSVDEWDQRVVCPDGACIGVIGPDGLCKVCGRVEPNWGDERKRGLVEDGDDDDDDDDDAAAEADGAYDGDDDDDDDDDEAAETEAAGESAAVAEPHERPDADVSAYEWSRRTLCPDGACVGVIGPNGKCTVCGKAAA